MITRCLTSLLCASVLGLAGQPLASLAEPASRQTPGPAPDPASDLFARPRVLALELQLPPESYSALQGRPRQYVRATVREGAHVYTEVAIHLKGGAGSMRPLNDKPALTLSFEKFNPGQDFHGLKKLHLNNSVQDESCMTEIICGELFRAAGVPAARGTHALVTLNGRPQGLYVLKEGFDKRFLRQFFPDPNGTIFDTGYRQDINERVQPISGKSPAANAILQEVGAAFSLPEPQQRLDALRRSVDLDHFLSFMALEVLTVHWDGYAMFKNNYRIYADPKTQRLCFIAHGMDQMFQQPECSLLPAWDGLVARNLMETAEGKKLYLSRIATLASNTFSAEKLTRRIAELQSAVRPALLKFDPGAAVRQEGATQDLVFRIQHRAESVKKQLTDPDKYATGQHPLFSGLVRPNVVVVQQLARPPGFARPMDIHTNQKNELPVLTARLSGPNIQLEGVTEAPNAGFWLDPADKVTWDLQLATAGKFNLTISYASAPETGGPFEVVVGEQHLRSQTVNTGHYQSYRDFELGTVVLPSGPSTLVVQPDGKFVFGLMNLRSVTLTPAK